MTSLIYPPHPARFIPHARLVASMIALSVLMGWSMMSEPLLTWGGATEMVPNTAICFLLLCGAVMVRAKRISVILIHLTDGLAVMVLFFAVARLMEWDVTLNGLLVSYAPRQHSAVIVPGRMAFETALAFATLALGLMAHHRIARRVSAVLAAVAVLAGVVMGHVALPTCAAMLCFAAANYLERRYV